MTATMTAEAGTTQPEVTIERFLEALWGIRVGESRPRLQPDRPQHLRGWRQRLALPDLGNGKGLSWFCDAG